MATIALAPPISTTAGETREYDPKTRHVGGKHPPSDSASEFREDEDIDGDYGSYHGHVFSDPKVAEYWRNVYDTATYEGRHRFDPNFSWTAAEEKAVKRK